MDYFLRVDGIKGESLDDRHKDEIDVETFSWGEVQSSGAVVGGGGGAGKVTMEPLQVTARTSKASPLLMLACASGQHIKTAVLTARKPGKAPLEFFVITLTDVIVAAYHVAGGESGPVDSVALGFARVVVAYTPQKPDGSAAPAITGGWDVKTHRKV